MAFAAFLGRMVKKGEELKEAERRQGEQIFDQVNVFLERNLHHG